MKMNKFLNKLKTEEKLELVEPSEEVCESYLQKSNNCLASAKLLLDNSLFENSVSMSYYAMYNSLISLLFRAGIKCENYAGSILLLKLLFGKQALFMLISEAKEERIDKQYYVATEKDEITKESVQELLKNAETFVVQMKLFIKNLQNEYTKKKITPYGMKWSAEQSFHCKELSFSCILEIRLPFRAIKLWTIVQSCRISMILTKLEANLKI